MDKLIYRGQWQGLTLRVIAAMMGATVPTARSYMNELARRKGDRDCVNLADIGELIHRYRDVSEHALMMRWKLSKAEKLALVLPGGMTYCDVLIDSA